MTEAIQTIGKQVSFPQLFEEFAKVEIPIIQRDYAQGRAGQEELRQEFLAALKSALLRDVKDATLPLDLDFVYGSAFIVSSPHGGRSFAPLDGQQRLTTLFLLHWYLAWKDGRAEDFQLHFVINHRSRFSYEVRPSSHEFFNALGSHFPVEMSDDVSSLELLLRDQSWFFQAWRNDPTIISALKMLEEIHQLFRDCKGYYERLVDTETPRITFQLLELKHFGLSDDLYIKMNSRGKALTPFETFKARLEQHLDELLPDDEHLLDGRVVPISEYFSHRMDTAWTDLFWERRDPESNLFDTEVMRLVKAISLVCINPDDPRASRTVSELRSAGANVSFAKLQELQCLNAKMLQTLVAVLDYWSEQPPEDTDSESVYNSQRAFEQVTGRELTYPDLVKFAGFCTFIRSHALPIALEDCASWLRIVTNLVNNSDIERPADFIDSLKSINALHAHADYILEHLSKGGEVTAFSRQQVREERIKAALILRGTEWKDLIAAAERHAYFDGQIEFLLGFAGVIEHWLKGSQIAWSKADDESMRSAFEAYLQKAKSVFDAGGLRPFRSNLWERALLANGDYTLTHGKNHSFLQSKLSSGDRRPTWKMLLRGHLTDPAYEMKRNIVKSVLDKIDLGIGVEKSLEAAIRSVEISDQWRKMLVRLPQAIEYCTQKMFRFQDNRAIYLISKLRTSSEHLELWSYYLYETVLAGLDAKGELGPLVRHYEPASNDDYIPSAVLKWRKTRIEIDFIGQFRFSFELNDAVSNKYLISEVGRTLTLTTSDTWAHANVPGSDIRKVVQTIAAIAMEFDDNNK